jgi:hypothetical protein
MCFKKGDTIVAFKKEYNIKPKSYVGLFFGEMGSKYGKYYLLIFKDKDKHTYNRYYLVFDIIDYKFYHKKTILFEKCNKNFLRLISAKYN